MTGAADDSPAPFLAIDGLVMAFGGVRAVDGVSLTMGAGEMRAVIGPNGCGKTTLFNLITGVLTPTAGHISFRGRRIDGQSPSRVARAGIVRKFQVPSVFAELTVAENLAVAAAVRPRGGRAAGDLLALTGLAGRARETAGALSHGEAQWLELAMVLATGPSLVLLDEPAAGMTRTEKERTVAILSEVRHATGVALIVIEHDMHFVGALDCRVEVMMDGRLIAGGSLADVRGDPRVREGYLGRRAEARHG